MNKLLRFFGIAFIFTFILPAILAAWSLLHTPSLPSKSVLHVRLDGPLPELARPSLTNLWAERMGDSLHDVAVAIRAAGHDDKIVGLVLDVRTNALGMAQLSELRAALRSYQASKKMNLAYLQPSETGGTVDRAYALATAAERVVLAAPSELALQGLRAEVPFLRETFKRLHVQPTTEQRYEYKTFANTFTQQGFTPEHLSSLKDVLDDVQETLLQSIAEGRHVSLSEVRSWVLGAPWAPQAALTAKLVDRTGYWDDVVAETEALAGRKDALIDLGTYQARRKHPSGGPKVAFIVASGEIRTGDAGRSPLEPSSKMGSDTLTEALRDARADAPDAILLRVDSPGGSWVASDLIRREVQLCREANLPVVVSMGDVAASGGYLIATEADHIVVEAGSITGSIGVVAASFAVREALHHFAGINVGVYETLPHPGSLNMLDPPTPADRSRLSRTLDGIYDEFVGRVASTRHKSREQIHALAKGRIWSGRQAVKNGLADEEGGIHTALAYLRRRLDLAVDAPLQLRTYPEPQTPFDVVRDYISSEVRIAHDGQARGVLLGRLIEVAQSIFSAAAGPTARLPLGHQPAP